MALLLQSEKKQERHEVTEFRDSDYTSYSVSFDYIHKKKPPLEIALDKQSASRSKSCYTEDYEFFMINPNASEINVDFSEWEIYHEFPYFDFEIARIFRKHETFDNFRTSNLSEERMSEDETQILYKLLTNPKDNPNRKRILREALELFPNPEQPTEIDIDL